MDSKNIYFYKHFSNGFKVKALYKLPNFGLSPPLTYPRCSRQHQQHLGGKRQLNVRKVIANAKSAPKGSYFIDFYYSPNRDLWAAIKSSFVGRVTDASTMLGGSSGGTNDDDLSFVNFRVTTDDIKSYTYPYFLPS